MRPVPVNLGNLNLKVLEVFVDKEDQKWFKRAHVGKFLGLFYIHRLIAELSQDDQQTCASLQAKPKEQMVRQ